MPILKVVLNAKGEVLGTANLDVTPTGTGAPQQVMVVAGPGQRIVDVNVDDNVVALDPGALHAAVSKSASAKPAAAKRARGGKAKTRR